MGAHVQTLYDIMGKINLLDYHQSLLKVFQRNILLFGNAKNSYWKWPFRKFVSFPMNSRECSRNFHIISKRNPWLSRKSNIKQKKMVSNKHGMWKFQHVPMKCGNSKHFPTFSNKKNVVSKESTTDPWGSTVFSGEPTGTSKRRSMGAPVAWRPDIQVFMYTCLCSRPH